VKAAAEDVLHESLVIELRNLPASGWHFEAAVPKEALADSGTGQVEPLSALSSDMFWKADLNRAGDCYHLSGVWEVELRRNCSRCNCLFTQKMRGETLRDYRLANERGEYDDDSLPEPGRVNLLDVLREDVWLASAPFPLCRPDCRGLCPRCGSSLNDGDCSCRPDESSHPFAALRKVLNR